MEPQPIFLNRYQCPYDWEEWETTHDCKCNDKCPVCNKEIQPYESLQLN